MVDDIVDSMVDSMVDNTVDNAEKAQANIYLTGWLHSDYHHQQLLPLIQ